MNSSSKVPPRFVPTLTEVVQHEPGSPEEAAHSGHAAEPQEALGYAAQVLDSQTGQESTAPVARASFHTPWLADGLYVRNRPATIPHQLPPLPESLPPQQPFAEGIAAEASGAVSAEQTGHEMTTAEFVQALPSVDRMAQPSTPDPAEPVDAEALPWHEELHEDASAPVAQLVDVDPAIESPPALEEADLPQALDVHGAVAAEEYLVHRLMQRVDLVLEHKLKEAIAQVVEAQTRSMVLRLREEVETVVRQSVYEAVEAELALQARQ